MSVRTPRAPPALMRCSCLPRPGAQRAMEQQAKLAEGLLEENEVLTRRHNEQGGDVEALQREVAELSARLAGQV